MRDSAARSKVLSLRHCRRASGSLQDADGYFATVKAGEIVVEHDEVTDARPGRMLKATDTGVKRI